MVKKRLKTIMKGGLSPAPRMPQVPQSPAPVASAGSGNVGEQAKIMGGGSVYTRYSDNLIPVIFVNQRPP